MHSDVAVRHQEGGNIPASDATHREYNAAALDPSGSQLQASHATDASALAALPFALPSPQPGRLAPSGHHLLSSLLIGALRISQKAVVSVSAGFVCHTLQDNTSVRACSDGASPFLALRQQSAQNANPFAPATLNCLSMADAVQYRLVVDTLCPLHNSYSGRPQHPWCSSAGRSCPPILSLLVREMLGQGCNWLIMYCNPRLFVCQ